MIDLYYFSLAFFFEQHNDYNLFLGPLTAMVNGRVTVVGSTSFGFTGCPTTAPPVFARITAGKNWILANSDAANYQCSTGAVGK